MFCDVKTQRGKTVVPVKVYSIPKLYQLIDTTRETEEENTEIKIRILLLEARMKQHESWKG
jgi:hypothetical protein